MELPAFAKNGMRTHWLWISLFVALSAFADAPERINYQGKLLSGTNLVNGVQIIVFRLYDAPENGGVLYSETQTVTVSDGFYSSQIGLNNPLPGSLVNALAAAPVYLEVEVGGTPMAPREPLVSAAYSLTSVSKSGDTVNGPLTLQSTGVVGHVLSFPSTNGNWYLARHGDQDNNTWHLSFNGYIPPDGSPWTFAEITNQPCYLIGFESKFDNGAFVGGESYISYLPIGSTNWRNREMGYYNATNDAGGYKIFSDPVVIHRGFVTPSQPANDFEMWGQAAFHDNIVVGYETSETNRTDGKVIVLLTMVTNTAETNLLGTVAWAYRGTDGTRLTGVVMRVYNADYWNSFRWSLWTLNPFSAYPTSDLSKRLEVGPWLDNTNIFTLTQTLFDPQTGIILGGVWTNAWPSFGTDAALALGQGASAEDGVERVAIGHNLTNWIDDSAAVRGTLYTDGGTGLFMRATFGEGNWSGLYTDGTNLFFMNATGATEKITHL